MVGSSAIRSLGSQESAIAIATRCRIPPESWCGYCASLCSGAGMPTAASSSTLRFFAVASSSSRCSCSVSISWVPIVSTGFSDVIGSWNTTASDRPRSLRSFSGESRSRSWPSNITRPVSSAFFGSNCRIAREQHGLAAAEFADDTERPAGAHREVHPIHRAQIAARGRQVDHDVLDRKQRVVSHSAPCRGSVSARKVSPTRLKDSTVRNIAAAGRKASRGATSRLFAPLSDHAAPA